MGLHSDRSLGKHCALPRKIFRAGQAVESVRPENKFLVPCEHSLPLSLTMQRYESFIAVHEYYGRNSGGHDGHDGQGQNEKRECQNRHYNINILFIYSEQMTESDIDFDQNDHDHFDQNGDALPDSGIMGVERENPRPSVEDSSLKRLKHLMRF